MDITQTSVLIGSVSAAIGGILTLAATKGIDAYLKYKADARTDEIREEAKEETDLRFIIGRQDAELTSLRTELKEKDKLHRDEMNSLHKLHNECEKKHTALEVEFRVRMELMTKQVDKIEARQVDKIEADAKEQGKA
jgi:hypothetical protein